MRRPYAWIRHAQIVARFERLSRFCDSFFYSGNELDDLGLLWNDQPCQSCGSVSMKSSAQSILVVPLDFAAAIHFQ